MSAPGEPEADSPRLQRERSLRLLLYLGVAGAAALFGAAFLALAVEDDQHRLWHALIAALSALALVPGVLAWARLRRAELQESYHFLQDNHAGLLRAERLASAGLVAGAAVHEINNPVSVILGHVHLLREMGRDPALQALPAVREAASSLDAVEKAAKQIQTATGGLLGFLRPGPAPDREVDFNRVVEDVLRLAAPQVRAGGVRAVRDLAPSLPPLQGDPRECQQVLMNLVLNALQAMPAGGTLTLRTRGRDGEVEVEVADTGTGMAEEVQRHLFEPFFTTKPQGTGLGLALVRSIVQRRGGSVEFRSRAGEGTTFVLRFPASPPGVPR